MAVLVARWRTEMFAVAWKFTSAFVGLGGDTNLQTRFEYDA